MRRTDLLNALSGCPAPGSCWRHYKGEFYYALTCAVRESDGEPLVIYRQLGDCLAWCRPLREWEEPVQHEGRTVPRFTPA